MPRPTERTDSQVVRDVLAGDRDAYRLLVRRYGGVLYGHALRMVGNPDDAADLAQRSLVKGFRKLASCREPERVGAWLFRILANLSKDFVRGQRRAHVGLDRVPDIPESREGPLDAAHWAEVRNRLQAALGRLTAEQREAFTLKHIEGRSYEEMAAVLDLPVAALKMRVHRARQALRGMLERYR